MSLNRTLAGLITTTGDVKTANLDNVSAGLTVYATLDDLPTTGLTSGDQAYVSATSRFYISNGSGWYNVALVNATPNLTIDPTGTIILAQDGSTTSVITLTGTDSDYPDANLTYSVESDGSFFGLGTVSQDSSVFTITPLSQDSATTSSATLTFKASDGISFGSASRSFSLFFTTTNSHKTMSLIKADTSFNDNQVDASTNTHTITELGNVTSTAFSPYHPGGYSTYFDGTGDYMTIPHDTGFDFGTGDFTVEFYIYSSSYAGDQSVVGTYNNGGSSGFLVQLTANAIRVYKGATTLTNIDASSYLTANTWHHITVTRSGTDLRTFIDGTLLDTTTDSTDFTYTGLLTIGRLQHSSVTQYVNGYIKDLRVVKGTAVYTSTFSPPLAPLTAISGTSLLTCHLPYIADGSTNGHAITIYGNTSTKRFSPYDYLPYTKTDHGGSVYFDGTSDGFEIASATATQFGTGEWTIEGWFYPYDQAATQVLLYGYENAYATTPGTYELYVGTNGARTTPQINGNNGSWATSATSTGSTETFQYETWNHIVWSRSGDNLRIFVNGKSGANHAISSSQTYDMKRSESQFMDKDGSSGFRGYVSDLRVVKGDAVYTSDFTPPTQPLTAITNTELLTCTNRHNIVDVAGGSRITKTGQITTSDAERKFSTSSSTYHQGSNDWYSFTLPVPLADDFTVEMWFNHQLWDHTTRGFWDFSGGYGLGRFGSGSSAKLAWWDNNNNVYNIQVNSEMDALANTWWHFALCRTGGNSYKAFVNGVQEATWTLSGGISQTIRIGNDQVGGDLLGYAQDVRVTNGLARYTAAFTPPTAEFEG
jgi:hypothetical protein